MRKTVSPTVGVMPRPESSSIRRYAPTVITPVRLIQHVHSAAKMSRRVKAGFKGTPPPLGANKGVGSFGCYRGRIWRWPGTAPLPRAFPNLSPPVAPQAEAQTVPLNFRCTPCGLPSS